MGIKDGTHEFTLARDLPFKMAGETETTRLVVLREPGMEHIKHYLRLKQMITRSQMELVTQASEIDKMRDAMGDVVKPLADDVEKIESETEGSHEIISLALQSSEKVDIARFIGVFEKMVCTRAKKAVCMVDDRIAMTGAVWNHLHPNDAYEMAVRWCAFFGMPSLEGQKTTSDPQSESLTEPMEA